MKIFFEDKNLIELLRQKTPTKGISIELIKSFQKVVSILKAARDQRDIRVNKGLRLEKVKKYHDGRYSIRVTRCWRLYLKFESIENENVVIIMDMNNHNYD